MKKPVHFLICLCILFTSPLFLKAGKPPVTKWMVNNPFEQKVFIENKGQYSLPNNVTTEHIVFGSRKDGLSYYFTASGIYIEHDVQNSLSDKNAYTSQLHQIDFIGANSLTEIIGAQEVKQHYNFKLKGATTITANAFEKIIYKNLYPGIDMEFYFPENKTGFEYSFIVHAGGDVSKIQMQYPLSDGLQLNTKGNITIPSAFGSFVDHAPIATQTTTQINCSFNLQNGVVQFKAGSYDKTQDMIIDPWTEVPQFQGSQSGRLYDLDWDNAGNCYVYGGSEHYAPYPFLLSKYDNTGQLLWTTATDDFLYGGFAVDRRTQSVYVTQGAYAGNGAEIYKLNQAGSIIDTSTGSLYLIAIIRIAFSSKYNELVGAGGSYPSGPAATAMYIDTNLTTLTPVYVLNPANPYHYMWGLTLDNYGNCYMATDYFWQDTSSFNNQMFKLPMPSLSPNTWEVRDGYQISLFQPQYIDPHNNGEGLNGITVSDTTLYIYDSYTLKKWGTTNGNLIATLNIDGDTTLYSYWGGLTSDNCNDIFLGSHDTIKQYNSSLALVTNIVEPDSIYDLKLGNNNILYVCGAQFVAAIQLNPLITTVVLDSAKLCAGDSATLIPTGAITYSWFPPTGLSSTNGDTVIAKPSVTTTYSIVGIGLVGCPDTVHTIVKVDSVPIVSISSASAVCLGQSISLLASGASTYQWSPSNELNTTAGDSVIASPSITTTYSVTGFTSDGCMATATTVINVFAASNKPTFTHSGDTLISSAKLHNQWYRNDTLLIGDTSQDLIISVLGEYWVAVNNVANGCSTSSDSIKITSLSGLEQLSSINQQLSIYPNPFSNEVFIKINSSAQDIQDWGLQITDVLGRSVFNQSSLGYNNVIDLGKIISGMYFITIINKIGRVVFPLVKQE